MLRALIIVACVHHIVEHKRRVLARRNAHIQSGESRITTGALGHVVEIDEEGQVTTRLLLKVANVEKIVVRFVLLSRVIPNDLRHATCGTCTHTAHDTAHAAHVMHTHTRQTKRVV